MAFRSRRDRSCWLGSIHGSFLNLYVVGCRAGLFWCSLTRRTWAFRFSFRFSVRPTLSSSVFYCRVRRSRSVEPPVLRLHFAWRTHDRPIVRQPLLRFLFPSAFAGRAALSEAASLRTIPLQRCACRVPDSAGVGLSGADIVLAVFPPCVHRAPGPRRAIVVTVHTGPIRVIRHGLSFAWRSATRSIEPFHDWAGPAFDCSVRQRSWDSLCPSQFSLSAGSPHFCGSSPHAVIQIIRARAR